MGGRHNHYREANTTDSEAHPIDDELERRLRHGELSERIIAAQGRVIAALGEQRPALLTDALHVQIGYSRGGL